MGRGQRRWRGPFGLAGSEDPSLPEDLNGDGPSLVPAKSSIAATTDSRGLWSQERKALHKQIIADATNHKRDIETPKLVFVAGGPASGKSTIVKSGSVVLPEDPVMIDVDSVKEQLPEYNAMVAAGDPNAAAYVHEESSALGSRIRRKAQDQHSNVVLDGVGNSDFAKLKRKVDDAHAKGYEVEAHYVTVPTDVALARNQARYEKTGRLVPDYVITNSHRKVTNAVMDALDAGLFDDFELWDTDTDGDPILVATAKGTDVQILNPERWQQFTSKGDDPNRVLQQAVAPGDAAPSVVQ